MEYFGSNIVEGVAESRVKAEMSWVEIEMSWVGMDGAGWSWVELSGGGWIWVGVGSRFSNTQKMENLRNRIDLILKNNEKKLLKMDIKTN